MSQIHCYYSHTSSWQFQCIFYSPSMQVSRHTQGTHRNSWSNKKQSGMFVRKLPHYYCIVVTFSQTPKFIRSLHSFLDRKHSAAHSPLYTYSLSVAVTPTLDFPPKPHIIITEISRPPHPIRAKASQQHQEQNPAPLGRKKRGAEDNAKADNK